MIKVIGAGLFRTGTLSLKEALEMVGFTKCYHFKEIVLNPAHIPIWLAVVRGKTRMDWEQLFAGYQATTDSPACHYYRELMEKYPAAKVILTVRDPERWYQSVYDTVYSHNRPVLQRKLYFAAMGLFKPEFKNRLAAWEISERLIWQGIFQSRFTDKAFAIELFNQHSAEVKRTVPSDRLLVYNLKEGWEPLCRFLEVPTPDQPFPHLNDTASFLERRKQLNKNIFRA